PVSFSSVVGVWDGVVAAGGGEVAVVCGGVSLSFGEVDQVASRLAGVLRLVGVGPEVRVGVVVPRGVEVVVVMVAVWKAGGVVVPVDPAHPVSRVGVVVGEAAPLVVVTSSVVADRVAQAGFSGRTILV
ncbi:AMP-binding protein, partial [Frankia sp. ACN10a]|uniref:AMP-binding protein n=1 Tax=Frankia sp. ACN10a TaxID=2926031 RepID=UPI002117F08E